MLGAVFRSAAAFGPRWLGLTEPCWLIFFVPEVWLAIRFPQNHRFQYLTNDLDDDLGVIPISRNLHIKHYWTSNWTILKPPFINWGFSHNPCAIPVRWWDPQSLRKKGQRRLRRLARGSPRPGGSLEFCSRKVPQKLGWSMLESWCSWMSQIPITVGWWKKRGFFRKVQLDVLFPLVGWWFFFEGFLKRPPWKPQVSMMIDGINHNPAPLFLPKGHYCPGVVGKHKLWIVAKSTSNSE